MANCGCHSHQTPTATIAELEDRLRGQARKITGPRLAILELMRRHPHPLTNKEVHATLPAGSCDLATIYRSMHLLERMGLVQKFDFGDGVARFELVGGQRDHHHHLVCTECGRVLEVDECFVEELERSIARRHGFRAIRHKLEFFGICPDCQGKSSFAENKMAAPRRGHQS
jgi:Fur family transcriptional regulator, ferric uptake regulator